MARVLVVGGGIAGLAAARRLALADQQVGLVEAGDRLGGMIQPATLRARDGDAVTIDIGAEAFAVRGGAVERLVRELGLAADVVEPRALGSWAYGAEGAYRMPAGGLTGIPGDPGAEGLEAAIGTEGVAAVRREADLDPAIGADAESLAALVRARFGDLVLERLVAPVVRGVYSLDPEVVDHRVLMPRLAERLREEGSLSGALAAMRAVATPGALVRTVRGGMHRLVRALEDECRLLGVEIRLGVRARLEGDRVLLEQAPADHAVRRVLGRTPGVDTGPLLLSAPLGEDEGFDRILTTVESALGHSAPPVSTEVVALLLDAPELDAHPRGTGVLVADAAGVEAKALTHASAKWPWLDEAVGEGGQLLRLSYGPREEGGAARTLGLDGATLRARALRDASTLLGVELRPEQVLAAARQHWCIPQPAARLGRRAELDRVQTAIDARPEVEVCGTWCDGTGLAHVIPAVDAAVARIIAQ